MPRLLESDAEFLTLNYDALSPENQAKAQEWFSNYRQQQADEGEPLFPTQEKTRAERQAWLRSMFEAPDKIDYDPGPMSLNPELAKMQHANMALLSARYQKEPAEVASRYDFLLNDYARQKLGASEDVDTAKFYALAQKDMQRVKLREDTQREGMSAALRGEDGVKALAAWQAKNADRAKDDAGLFMRGYQQALEQDGEMLPIADRLLPLLEAQSTKKDGQAFDQAKAQELGGMIEQLAGMKKAQRKSVYRSIAARIEAAGYDQKGFWSQMLGYLDQQLYRAKTTLSETGGIASDVASNFPAMLAEGMTGNRDFGMTPAETAQTDASVARRKSIGNVQEEIMQIVSGELDPVKPTTGWMNETLETGLIKGPGAVAPFMAASALLGPYGAGFVFTADFAAQNRRELVQSGLDDEQAQKIAVMAAPFQAAVESLSNMVSLGKFPAVQAALSRFTRPVGGASLVGRYVQNSLISGATEFTEEQVQDNVVVPVMQELLGALEKDVPEVDWSFYKTRAANATPELAATLLPMALVFGGVMTAADARLSDRMTSNVDALTALNYSQAQATEIVQEKTPEARIAKAASLWRSRAGNKATLEKGAAKLAERLKALSGDAVAYQAELERRGVLPRVMHTAENDWLLTFNDGSTARFATHDEASTARWTWAEDQLGRVHALTREALTSMERNMSTNRELGVEFKPDVRMVEAGQTTPDIQRRVEQGKVLGDIDPNEAFDTASMVDRATAEADGFLSSYQILGSSRNEFKDGVLRTTIKLWEGSNVLTLVEEKLEGDAKAIVASRGGRGWMLAALRNYEQESGDKLFREVPDDQLTDDDLVEAWSHLGQSYLVGRSSFGEPLQQNNMRRFSRLLMRAGLAGALNSESTFWQAVVNRAQKLGELKAAGKLGEDVVAELEKQLGIDSQVKHEQGAMQEAQQVRDEVAQQVDTSGYSETNPGPNGETFSLAKWSKNDNLSNGFLGTTSWQSFRDSIENIDPSAKGGVSSRVTSAGTKDAELTSLWRSGFTAVPNTKEDARGGEHVIEFRNGRAYKQTHPETFGAKFSPETPGSLVWGTPLEYLQRWRLFNEIFDGADVKFEGVVMHPNGALSLKISQPIIEGPHPSIEHIQEALKKAGWKNIALNTWEKTTSRGTLLMTDAKPENFKVSNGTVVPVDVIVSLPTSPRAIPADASKVVQMPDGKPVSQETFSLRVTPAQDAEYMAAVEAGDMQTAQRMVDDAATGSGLETWFHGNTKSFGGFSSTELGVHLGTKESAQDRLEQTGQMSGVVNKYYVDIKKPVELGYDPDTWQAFDVWNALPDDVKNKVEDSYEYVIQELELGELKSELQKLGFDGIKYPNAFEGVGDSILVFDKAQIKSADPVTRDESGNVIPLSQRFNPADDRITYSLRPGDFASRVEAMFSPFQRSPEARLVMARVAKDRALRLGNELIEKANVIRTMGSIDREARVRAALAEDKAVQDYLDGLTPAARQTLEWQPADLQDDPLIAAMLDFGKLMSKTTALQRGKLDLKMGDFDGAPWLPPSFYSKGAGIMPDQMAQAMFDAGLLPDAYTDTLWSELSKRIEATRKDKAAHREAVQAFKDAKKAARDAALKEAGTWADNAKKQAGSGKAQRDRIKAWLRVLDGILAASPPEVRARVGGFVKMAGIATDEAALRYLEDRVAKLDKELEKWLKKDATGSINRLFKRAAADYTAGKKAKGKLGPDEHYLFQRAEAASEMDAAALRGELAKLDALADDESLSDDQRALAVLERGIVELVGDMKNADSGRLFTAFDELSRLYAQGVVAWKAKQTARREARQAVRDALKADAGKSGVLKERQAMEKAMTTLFGKAKSAWLSVSSFSEVLRYAFGAKSQQATELIDGEREASNAYKDEQQAIAEELEGFFASMAGGKVLDGERLRFDMAQRTIKAGDVELSQFEAITALLMWRQEDGRRHMEGTFDENGQRTSGWSYDQAWVDEVEKQLTPEGRRVMAWLAAKYGSEHGELNALYRERHGVNLPAHDNYAPITVKPMQAKAGEIVDPVSGAAVSGSILTPGSLRTRSRMAVAEPEFRDALQTFVAHKKQMGYWKAYYDLATDMQAVLGNRELMNSVEAAVGKEAVVTLRKWMDVLAQGGVRDAAAGLAMNGMFQRMMNRAATVGLLGRVSTLLVQSTQLAAASVQMPVGAYLRRFGKLFDGQLDWKGAIQSAFIQRRIKTAPPIVRQAFENLANAKSPNEIKRATYNLGKLLSGTDGLFTGGTYAILLDYHRETGRKLGLTGDDLEEHAHREAERATEEVAQPTRTATRSLAELTATNPLAKVSFAYASEARQKIALLGWAAVNFKADPVRFGKAAFLVFGVGGVMSQVLKNIWKEAKGDDDEEKWSPERLIKGSFANALHGIPMASELMGEPGMFSSTAWAQASLDDLLKGEADMRDINTLLGTVGLFNDTAAGVAAMSNAGYDFAKIIEAAFSDASSK